MTDTDRTVDALLQHLWEAGGTDLILTSGTVPLMRIDGELRPVPGGTVLDDEGPRRLLDELLSPDQLAAFEQAKEYDFSFSWQGRARVRGNAFRQRDTVAVALRVIPTLIPSFDDLGLPASAREFATRQSGLVLVTGPTGSGKSTTLASMIDWINRNRAVHVITIEDPIEYVHTHQRSAVNQREVGVDTDSFPAALRSALREDPDVLLVGEMRDLESIQFALTIAETGHLVFATLHTNDSAQSVDRLVDVFPAARQDQIRVQLANSLSGIVYQQLVPRVDGGMVAAYEVLIATSAVRNLVKEGKTNQLRNVVATHQTQGMQTLEDALGALVSRGLVSLDAARMVSLHPKDIRATEPTTPPIPIGAHRSSQAG